MSNVRKAIGRYRERSGHGAETTNRSFMPLVFMIQACLPRAVRNLTDR